MSKKPTKPKVIKTGKDFESKKDLVDCKDCGNYIDDKFMNPNCSGCSKNPFYINCFTPKR